MKIALLASDEATAPLYRVRLLARALMRVADVQVLGFKTAPTDPLSPRDFPYSEIQARPWPAFAADAARLARLVDADILYAMKCRPTSLGLALAVGRHSGRPVLVDIDDEELAMIAPYSRHAVKNLACSIPRLHDPNAWPYTWIADKAVSLAAGMTVVSRYFQRRYGGVLLPQLVDPTVWDPARYPRPEARARFGLDDRPAIAFVGIAQPNKGTDDLLAALKSLPDPGWTLLIAGPVTPHARDLARKDPRVRLTGTLAPSDAPWALAAADLVALPQRDEPASRGQVPIKLVEAMAMAKAIVATRVSDIPDILAGTGWIAAPGDPRDLALALAAALASSPGCGLQARQVALRHYSYDAGLRILDPLLRKIARRGHAAG